MRSAAAAAVVLALALDACGSRALSASELRSRASAICAQANARTDRIVTPSSPAGGAPFLERGLAALDPELTDLARLRPPDGLKLIYARTLSVFSSELQAIGQTALLLRRGRDPVAAIERLQRRLAPLEAQANRGWNALGLHACVNR